MASVGNLPLWRRLVDLQLASWQDSWLLPLGFGTAIAGCTAALLCAFAGRWSFKPVATLLLLITAFSAYFMGAYGVLMSPGMMLNVLQTDVPEVRGLLSLALLWQVLVLAVLPAALLWKIPLRYGAARTQLWRRPLWVLIALLVALIAGWSMFQPFSSAMRNYKELRYQINPLASVYSFGEALTHDQQRAASPLRVVGSDATIASAPGQSPKLLLLIVGETARSASFSINGYARGTTPELQKRDVLSFTNAYSCGTSTAESLPCMFSPLGRESFMQTKERYENVLDVLQRAGLAVLWLDNQSGCKGLCARVPTEAANDGSAATGCTALGAAM